MGLFLLCPKCGRLAIAAVSPNCSYCGTHFVSFESKVAEELPHTMDTMAQNQIRFEYQPMAKYDQGAWDHRERMNYSQYVIGNGRIPRGFDWSYDKKAEVRQCPHCKSYFTKKEKTDGVEKWHCFQCETDF